MVMVVDGFGYITAFFRNTPAQDSAYVTEINNYYGIKYRVQRQSKVKNYKQ